MSKSSKSNLTERQLLSRRLNWLRAAVLGANDGIVSTAGIVMGVAGATSENGPILIAGVAAMVAGSISMAGGEYASVSAQRDSEIAAAEKIRKTLASDPSVDLEEMASYCQELGVSRTLALEVAKELATNQKHEALSEIKTGKSSEEYASPSVAAFASFVAFALGSVLPIIAIAGPWAEMREVATVVAVVVALALTGYFGAKIGRAKPFRAVVRNVIVSLLTMGIAFAIGSALGVAVG